MRGCGRATASAPRSVRSSLRTVLFVRFYCTVYPRASRHAMRAFWNDACPACCCCETASSCCTAALRGKSRCTVAPATAPPGVAVPASRPIIAAAAALKFRERLRPPRHRRRAASAYRPRHCAYADCFRKSAWEAKLRAQATAWLDRTHFAAPTRRNTGHRPSSAARVTASSSDVCPAAPALAQPALKSRGTRQGFVIFWT